ncbi:response regulator [Lichenicoccus sp.]|uniref:response regulator n=1 Tax=Lichenicoccus sp. TaxID=2781899 RepID=UPI003D0E4428
MTPRIAALANLRILVVEDEVIIVMMLEDILEEYGCIVEVAPSIERAVESLRARPPDGVLLDMNIHGTIPLAVAEELVQRSVPFLMVTGYAAGDGDPDIIKTAPRLQKPFHEDELGRRMVEVFGDHSKHAAGTV